MSSIKDILEPIIQAIIDEFIDNQIKKIMKNLIEEIPFFGLKFVNPIAEYFIRKFAYKLFHWGIMEINELQIRTRVYNDSQNVVKARKKAVLAIIEGNEDEIKKADEELINASDDLLNYGRSILRHD